MFVSLSALNVPETVSELSADVVINTLSPDLTYIHGKLVFVILENFLVGFLLRERFRQSVIFSK